MATDHFPNEPFMGKLPSVLARWRPGVRAPGITTHYALHIRRQDLNDATPATQRHLLAFAPSQRRAVCEALPSPKRRLGKEESPGVVDGQAVQ